MRMRIGAMVLGLVGALSGYFVGGLFFGVGGAFLNLFGGFFADITGQVIAGLVAFLVVSILGLIGAAMTLSKPTAAGVLMLLSGVIMLVMWVTGVGEVMATEAVAVETILYTPGTIPLVIAGILALVARKEED
jgi:hypothetical protein